MLIRPPTRVTIKIQIVVSEKKDANGKTHSPAVFYFIHMQRTPQDTWHWNLFGELRSLPRDQPMETSSFTVLLRAAFIRSQRKFGHIYSHVAIGRYSSYDL